MLIKVMLIKKKSASQLMYNLKILIKLKNLASHCNRNKNWKGQKANTKRFMVDAAVVLHLLLRQCLHEIYQKQ